jgi:transposase
MAAAHLAHGKKNAERLGAHIAFADESGFQLIPSVRRTWGPRGQTPIVQYLYKHDRISAISAVTVSPSRRRLGLYFQLHRQNIKRPEVCQFLRHLLKHLRGHVIVILDNGRPHYGEDIQKICQRFPRLHLEYFPAYAPELNPDEGIWSQAKHLLANGRPERIDDLADVLTKTLRRLKNSPSKLRWCIHQSDLPPFLR